MKRIILLTALCAAFAACKKESKPESPYVKVPDDVWSYIKLTPGSWYIYKDSATGLTDSVDVTVSTVNYKVPQFSNLSGNPPVTNYYNDDYNLTLKSVDLSGNETTWLDASSRSIIYYAATSPNYWELDDLIHDIILMQYPSNLSGYAANYKIPSAAIEGHIYSDILVVQGSLGSSPGEVWWTKAIGIVKLTRTVGSEIKTALLLRKK
jgi:hypothetical protein